MTDSANDARSVRRVETAKRMKAVARRLTAERGLSGFTIDDLCAEVGLSRRTFFNYFASKENAVLGIPLSDVPRELDAQFLAAGARGRSALVDDLIELQLRRWDLLDIAPADLPVMAAVFEREPRLRTLLLDVAAQYERSDIDIDLAVRREQLPAGDALASVAVLFIDSLLRGSATDYFLSSEGDSLRSLVVRRLAAARELLGD
jgi:AcrR family transcriptional regulator